MRLTCPLRVNSNLYQFRSVAGSSSRAPPTSSSDRDHREGQFENSWRYSSRNEDALLMGAAARGRERCWIN